MQRSITQKTGSLILIAALLLSLFPVPALPAPAEDQRSQEWQMLRAQGKYDLLAERLEKDVADQQLPLTLRLSGAMQLVEIYSLRMVDFAAAERAIRRADDLNEQLFGAAYVENLKSLRFCQKFLAYQKGLKKAPEEYTGLQGVDEIFVLPARSMAEGRARLSEVEALLRARRGDEDRSAERTCLAAAVIAAAEAGEDDKGFHYWQQLQQAVDQAEEEARAQAEQFKTEKWRAFRQSIWSGFGTVYMGAATAFVGVVTLGIGDDLSRGIKETRNIYQNFAASQACYQRSKRLTFDSDFASGLNLFLGYGRQVRLFAAIGRLYQTMGENEQARGYFRQGIEISEKLRSTLHSEQERIAFQAVRKDLYDRIITVLMALGKTEDALAYAERARSRAFLDALAGGRIDLRPDQGREAYAGINDLQAETTAMLANVRMSDAQVEWTRDKTRGIAVKLARQPAARHNLIHITEVVEPNLASVHDRLDEDQAILAYYCAGDEVFGWVITRQGVTGRRLGLTSGDLRALVAGELDNIRRRREGPQAGFLYRRLIAPFLPRIEGKRLLIVPHRALHALPFAALRGEKGYLAHDFVTAYCPSIAVWQLLKERPDSYRRRGRLLLVNQPAATGPWPALTWADRETDAVAALFGDRVTRLDGPAANKQRVRQLAASHDVLHLISHGYFDERSPLDSGLVLAGGMEGILRAREIFSMDLAGKLVVLSACETARSRILGGDEMMGLLRAFFFAGARDVVASLWMVDDASTAELMASFHRHLQDHPPGLALHLAQAELMRNEAFADPCFWAAFGVYGGE